MKKRTLLFVLLLTPFFSFSQDIDIPDPEFLSALIALGVDTNGDGLIQIPEAENIETLNLSSSSFNIMGLNGIEYFVNLRDLSLPSMVFVFNGTGLSLLETLSTGMITSFDLSANPNLKKLSCGQGSFTEIDLSNNPKLDSLLIGNPQFLTELDLSRNSLVRYVSLTYAWAFEKINLSNNPILEELVISYSPIEYIDISSNPDLQILNLEGAQSLQFMNLSNGTILDDFVLNTLQDDLEFICLDPNEINWAENNIINLASNPDVIVSTLCNHTQGAGFFNISGNIGYDTDGDCNYEDPIFPDVQFRITSDQGIQYVSSSSDAGLYDIFLLASTGAEYTITPLLYNNELFSISPSELVVNFDSSNPDLLQDFCISPRAPQFPDVRISIIPLDIARPGFDVDYKVIVENHGNVTSSGSMIVYFPQETVKFNDSGATWTNNGSFLSGNYSDLLPFQKQEYILGFTLNSPMDEPPLNDGDILKFSAAAFPEQLDHHSFSNAFEFCQDVVNSFDPNDKTCLNGPYINIDSLENNPVVYKIRFENTGTADAINITIKDHLDPYTFDISSIRVLDASHDVQLQTRSNIVDFIFEDINLPWQDDLNDGYVVFEVMTKEEIMVSDSILNSADIFFDFNFPIVTNTSQAEVVIDADNDGFNNIDDCDDSNPDVNPGATEIDSNGIDDDCDGVSSLFETDLATLMIYPNPTNDFVIVRSEKQSEQIKVLNFNGQVINTVVPTNSETKIDLSHIPKGIYFIKVSFGSSQKEMVQKLIKM